MPIHAVNHAHSSQPIDAAGSAVAGVSIDVNKWKQLETKVKGISTGGVSMADLLALLNEILEANQKLRSQVMRDRITEAKATTQLAVHLAEDRKHDAQVKFGISLAAGVMSMALQSVASVRMGQSKSVQDKHLKAMTGDSGAKVSDLSMKDLNKFTATLQQGRTAKYNMVGQAGNMANTMVGHVNDMQNAEQVKHQEEGTASKQLKEKVDQALDTYVQSLTQAVKQLNEILESMQKASLVTNR